MPFSFKGSIYAITTGSIFATRANVFLYLLYATVNIFLVFFRSILLVGSGCRAGELALVNLIFPLSTIHLSYLADLLDIRWNSYCKIYHATSWMAIALLLFYIIIAAIALGVLALYSILWLCYYTWQHFPLQSHLKIYFLAALGIFTLTFLLEIITLLYQNSLFAGRGTPRAIMLFSASMSKEEDSIVNAVHVHVFLPWPIKLWMQTHPFMVILWSKGRQDTMELLVRPCNSLTANLLRYTLVGVESLYESILVLASRSGIAMAILYLKKIIYGYNTCTSQVCQLYLILHILIYIRDGLKQNGLPFTPNYQNIISLEASSDLIKRLSNTWDKQGWILHTNLLVISTINKLWNYIQKVVQEYLYQGVKLFKLEYQPSTV
ncbi:uncharacterized protein BJX67DRAFT_371442 [Aspergillus lucknowensis]|uniref:G-protein coupled receptors family 1 profile domain-containing protein n=1 Tax=Aspergillus lucknowensis TaxID=176173 RepID=A0ABR4LV09_9EURO